MDVELVECSEFVLEVRLCGRREFESCLDSCW